MAGSGDPAGTEGDRTTSRARRGVALTVLVLLAWLVVGSVLGPLAGKLTSVQKNDNSSFLPASAESTKVNIEQASFVSQTTLPAEVLFVREAGLTPADVAAVHQFAADVPGLSIGSGATIGDYLAPGTLTPIPSQDGKALLLPVPLDSNRALKALGNGKSPVYEVVLALRHHATVATPDLSVYVTGPAGLLGDLFSVFGSLDTTLLGITALVVAVILIAVYRSPVLWVIPLLSALFALGAASGVVYLLAKNGTLTLNGQSQGILTVLVFGAGTDYALLLVARYREELHNFADPFAAMRSAWRGVLEPLVASASTVSLGLLCLLFSQLNSNRSTGPVAAIGIVCALIASLTVLPALLLLPSVALLLLVAGVLAGGVAAVSPAAGGVVGLVVVVAFVVAAVTRVLGRGPRWAFWLRWPASRWAFWPLVPRLGEADSRLTGVWSRVSAAVGRHPRRIWVVTTLGLLVLAFFVTTLHANGISQANAFTTTPNSVVGQSVLAKHFPAGSGDPAVVIANAGSLEAVTTAAKATPGVSAVAPYTTAPQGAPVPGAEPKVVNGRVLLNVTLADEPDSLAAQQTVVALREAVHAVPGADAIVGGFTAVNYDTQQASRHDRTLIIPIVLLVIFVILCLLLRAVLAPALLVLSVGLSFAATLGVCALVFNHVFHFAGADTSFPLFAFVFLVALGVDYNIFLMTRVREESQVIGTRPGILRALTVTGGVITSAGVILAATFSVLGTLPLVFLAELGFAVAFGVLLDTFLVRSLLVPALTYDIGRTIWWPHSLSRAAQPGPEEDTRHPVGAGAS